MESQLISRRPDGSELGAVRKTSIDELPGILARARKGEEALRQLGLEGRERILREAGARLRADLEAIAAIASEEMGKPLRESLGEARHAFAHIDRDITEIFDALRDEVLVEGKYRSTIVRDPFGVAACITPWNFPTLMPHQQIFPALAAGNAVIFKPSEEVPLTAEAYIERFRGLLPDGALTLIHGEGDLGEALVKSDVDLIVFTGSRQVGKSILQEAAKSFKRVILELGGKDPLIVLEDADLDAAAA
ncbi:MAG: aldehyde dehydrogenase, partial [Sandaracinaceae bacterium]|nr:aldehyde dehydrogenase [Sandaracinaceae bacterium]